MAGTKVKSKAKNIPELKIVLDTNAIYNQSAHYLLKQEITDLVKHSSTYYDIKILGIYLNLLSTKGSIRC